MSHYFNCLITIFIGVFVSSCLPDTIPVTYIGLNTTEIELILGDSDRESFQLIATVSPSDASNKQVHWSSSKGTVASVDHTGLVTALQVDDAPVIITATAEGGLTAECTVRVLKKTISVSEVLLNKTSLEIQPGETATLIASVLPSNAANKELIWSSSDEFVATVSAGKVKGVGSGKAIITATSEDGGKEATCEVTVTGSESDGPSADNAIDLSAAGSSNCYIVSSAGTYKFQPVKGNSYESVGNVASVEVLWESFGTDVTPSVGDLVKEVSYSDGYILFSTADNFRKGNAVIAAKDLSGTILWSWHIWLTDEPEGQVYYNNAGTMMDRNLGATSATPGEVGALGLLYQWGRKDPFLGSSNISNDAVAKSTGSWPSRVYSSSSRGPIEYAVKNPMTFITATSSSYYDDWHYSSRNNTLWESEKTIYDPCPAGWRVPDGGSNGVWSKALGFSSSYYETYDSNNGGINFSGNFGSSSTIWYPASGYRNYSDGSLLGVGSYGRYWSVTPSSYGAYSLHFSYNYGNVYPSNFYSRAYGQSVRCFKEDSSTPPTETPKEYENLSAEGTANSYIVSQTGDYKFEAVKGNSSESVGDVASVEVLWESFGTDETPSVGDLVKEVSYSDGYILFSTADDFRKGNAVIAAKDASGTILWSWHIWLTDEPEGQVYYKGAGTMMDRNLGATSAEPGDAGALGLLYQWGRKDPFLGSSKISNNAVAESTGSWPSAVSSSSSRGTVEYAVKNPMTFITYNSSNTDWYYTGSSSTDNTRWESEKTIYDPCPAGWRVPDGGAYGVWSKALGSSLSYYDTYDDSREGINFSGNFGSASTIWYPASGYRNYNDGSLRYVGYHGYYWSVTPYSSLAYSLYFYYYGSVYPSSISDRAFGRSVRCLQE